MSGASALKKINARVKKLAKKYPGKKRTTLQKQAGAEFRAGKLKARKPRKAKAKKTVKRKRARRKVASVGAIKRPAARRVRRRARRSSAKPKVIIRTRTKTVRVGSSRRKGIGPLGIIAGVAAVGLVAYALLKKPSTPVIIQSSNPTRNNTMQNIMMIAATAGVVGDQLTKLINTINSSSDTQVQQIYDNVKTNPTNIYSNIAGCLPY